MKITYLCFFAKVLRMTRPVMDSKNETTTICHQGAGKTEGPWRSLPSLEPRIRGNGSPTLLPKTVNTGQGKSHNKTSEHVGGFSEDSRYSGTIHSDRQISKNESATIPPHHCSLWLTYTRNISQTL